MWNRKDSSPENTITDITRVLDQLGLFTQIVDENNFEKNWFSLTVVFRDFPYIYANGKGVSRLYAMASAYGELMERLQTGQLLDNLFWREDKHISKQESIPLFQLVSLYRTLFPNIVNCFSDDELIIFLKENPAMQQLKIYHSLKSGNNIILPHGFIYALEGSNGTCAGNTKEEAIVQGLCEIFERHVQKELYYGDYTENDVPNIPIEWLRNLKSYYMIQKIIESGYHVVVKDLTFNGKFPVLGVLILNRKKNRYLFSMGSDIDMDICLQRCITELFQGRDFNFSFRESMKKIVDADNINSSNLALSHNDKNYILTLKSHNGCVPYYLLINAPETKNKDFKPFCQKKCTNTEALDYTIPIMLESTADIYILDCSYLGFPAYRLYCPAFNDAFYYNQKEFFTNISFENQVKVNRSPMPKKFDEVYLKNLRGLAQINRNVGFFDFTKYMGFTCSSIDSIEYLSDLRELCLKLSLQNQDYKNANYYLDIILDSAVGTNVTLQKLKQCILFKQKGVSDHDLKQLLQISFSENEIQELFDLLYLRGAYEIKLPYCPFCDKCKLSYTCQYEKWKSIMNSLENIKATFIPFYCKQGGNADVLGGSC